MRDDFLSADWARHHGSVSAGFNKLITRIAVGWERLTANQFDAPWRDGRRTHP